MSIQSTRKKELKRLTRLWYTLMKEIWLKKSTPEREEKMRDLYNEMEKLKRMIKMDKEDEKKQGGKRR